MAKTEKTLNGDFDQILKKLKAEFSTQALRQHWRNPAILSAAMPVAASEFLRDTVLQGRTE